MELETLFIEAPFLCCALSVLALSLRLPGLIPAPSGHQLGMYVSTSRLVSHAQKCLYRRPLSPLSLVPSSQYFCGAHQTA